MNKIKGFTLMELMIVVAILAIIIGIVGSLIGNTGKINDALNGVRCVAGYKVMVGSYQSQQLFDENNRAIPCK